MISSIESAALKALLSHYLETLGAKRLPSRQDIDALKLGNALPVIWISEYEPAAGTFRYRLAGEEVNDAFGQSVNGRLLSEIVSAERFDSVNAAFRRVIEEQAAMLAVGPVYRCTDRVALGERLALPLSSDGETADGLIGATVRKTLVDLDVAVMQEQKLVYVPVHDLAAPQKREAVGRLRG